MNYKTELANTHTYKYHILLLMIVKAKLGTVTAVELVFCTMVLGTVAVVFGKIYLYRCRMGGK